MSGPALKKAAALVRILAATAVCVFALSLAEQAAASTIPTVSVSTLTLAPLTARPLGVAKYVTVSTTITTVNTWLSGANSRLQTDNSSALVTDVSCPLKLTSSGAMATFSSVSDINSSADIDTLVDTVPQVIKLVREINWCNGPAPLFATIEGCGGIRRGIPFVILAANTMTTAGDEVLAHEYGHSRGLPHHTAAGDAVFVMYFKSTSVPRNVVNASECQAFQK